MKRLFLPLLLCFLSACSSTKKHGDALSDSAYENLVAPYTRQDQQYDGFQNVFDLRATLLTSQILKAQVARSSQYYLWNENFQQREYEKLNRENAKTTRIFISFFTPTKKHDNLDKAKSIWRIFLDSNGRRYRGKIKKVTQLTEEIKKYYPDHNRWSTPYMAVFSIPITAVEQNKVSLIITGPMGSTTFQYDAAPIKTSL